MNMRQLRFNPMSSTDSLARNKLTLVIRATNSMTGSRNEYQKIKYEEWVLIAGHDEHDLHWYSLRERKTMDNASDQDSNNILYKTHIKTELLRVPLALYFALALSPTQRKVFLE